jgi:hypothetical protein
VDVCDFPVSYFSGRCAIQVTTYQSEYPLGPVLRDFAYAWYMPAIFFGFCSVAFFSLDI